MRQIVKIDSLNGKAKRKAREAFLIYLRIGVVRAPGDTI